MTLKKSEQDKEYAERRKSQVGSGTAASASGHIISRRGA